MTGLRLALLVADAVAAVLALVRWLRVAQREHYLTGSVSRFAGRWWSGSLLALGEAALAACGAALSFLGGTIAAGGFLTACVIAVGPPGLSIRGRTSPLHWTRRLWVLGGLASVAIVGEAVLAGLFAGLRWATAGASVVIIAVPVIVDGALAALYPVEERIARRYVASARARLGRVGPTVVGITGSYGKTTTKGYVAHLVSERFSVVASPRSFNNQAGLARTVNDHLVPGTDVLIAEMGAYGPGEIASLCRWLPPDVAVITAIGPVHLERFKTLERTLAAKSEITAAARHVVLNVDDPRLAGLADELRAEGRAVKRCSGTTPNADVAVLSDAHGLSLYVHGELIGHRQVDADVPLVATNVACAAGVALVLGCTPEEVLARLADLPGAANRLAISVGESGVVVLDDTFNSNPAGARFALDRLQAASSPTARRVVVTPGMVELGKKQVTENAAFATRVGEVATDLVVVGRTNRRALVAGARSSDVAVIVVPNRNAAVAWVRSTLRRGDTVLYENDLPDHYR